MTQKQVLNKQRQDFLLTLFDKKDEYQTKEVNGFMLVKQFNGNNKTWQVAIYTPENYQRSQRLL